MINNKKTSCKVFQAERVGFEPTVPCGTRALQARALGRTTLPLLEPAKIITWMPGPQFFR